MTVICHFQYSITPSSFAPRYSTASKLPGEAVPYKTVLKNVPIGESQVPESADAVIIGKMENTIKYKKYCLTKLISGGGSIGCNTLYHLTKLGMKNVVLLERNRLTSGTTWHTAGLVWRLRPSDVDVSLLAYTHQLLQGLEEETGVNPGYIVNGGLFVASTKVNFPISKV